MLVLKCKIEITNKDNQKIKILGVNDLVILTSTRSLTDTAKITLPKKINSDGSTIDSFAHRGDKVSIDLGYEGVSMENVFNSYIKSVSNSMPAIIECENEMWQLKQIEVTPKTYKKFDLKKFLSAYNIDCNILETIEFGEVIISETATVAKVLDYLTSKYPFKVYYNNEGVLTAMLSNITPKSTPVILDRVINIIDDKLVYTLAENVNIIIKAKAILPDNKQIEAQSPKDAKSGEVRTFYAPQYKTKEELQKFADEKLKEFKVDKMTGTISIFGIPHIKKGNIIKLRYSDEKNKKFVVEGVKYSFGQSGYRQELTVGYEIKWKQER